MNPLAFIATAVLVFFRIQFFSATKHTTSFAVNVCDDCQKILKRRRRIVNEPILHMVAAFVAAFFVLFLIADEPLGGQGRLITGAILVIYGGLLYMNRSNIGAFDGQHFHFENPEFRRQFAQLNPELTSPDEPSR
jgi:hypothetical protein